MERLSLRSATYWAPVRRKRRILFVVSRDRADRFDSLAHAFSGEDEVQVIFDRRRTERRRANQPPVADRRLRDRRSTARAWAVRTMGWVRVSVPFRAS